MKKIIASTAALAFAMVAQGASAQNYDWSGPYVGVYAGLNSSKTDAADFDCNIDCDAPTTVANDFAGGGTLGYNVQVDDSFVLGLEGDFGTGANKTDRLAYSGGNWQFAYTTDFDWFATVRARAGLAVNRTLFYVTGGLALTKANLGMNGVNASSTDYGASVSKTLTGYAAGAGVEHAFSDNLTFKAEFLLQDFGSQSACFANTEGAAAGTCWNAGTSNTDDYAQWAPEAKTLRIGLNYKF